MAMFAKDTMGTIYTECKFKAGVWSGETEPTQYFDPANFTSFEITPPKQNKERVLSQIEGEVGNVLSTVFRPTDPATFKGVINTFDQTLGAIILGADVEDITQATDTIVDEAVTTVLNRWVPLAKQHISETGFTLETPGTPDVLIDSSKYVVDYVNGMIKAIHADAVGDKEASYTTLDMTGVKFKAGMAKTTKLRIVGTCTEKATGARGRIVIHRLTCTSDQAVNWSELKHMDGTLTGDLEVPADKTSAWEFIPFTVA